MDKTGAIVCYNQLGQMGDEVLGGKSLNSKQMFRHCTDQMVYLWTAMYPNDTDRVVPVTDITGVTLVKATKSDTILFVKECVAMMSTHFPEMTSSTADSVYEALLSNIGNDRIPEEYGEMSEYALGESPDEASRVANGRGRVGR